MRRLNILIAPLLLALLFAFSFRSFPRTAAQESSASSLNWAPCSDAPEVQCASLQVPVDPANPNGEQLTLWLGRVPASNPAQKKGVLLIIPGGPGAGINDELVGSSAQRNHIDELAQQFDVVSYDPRGIGRSDPVRCDPAAAPAPVDPILTPPPASQFQSIAASNAALYASCFAESGQLMSHLSSVDAAADIEQIRQALTPNDGLVAYGGSYGSAYGAAYLEQYPDHVKALVLDGVIDHSIDLPTFVKRNVDSVQDGFDRFTAWCADNTDCALHGQDLGAAYDAAMANVPSARPVVAQLLAVGPDPNLGWPALARMLGQLKVGDTSTLDELMGATSTSGAPVDPSVIAGKNGLDGGVFCGDYGPLSDYDSLAAASALMAQRSPRFAWRFWDPTPLAHANTSVATCLGWPNAATYPPHPLQVGSHPNVMVANNTHDSQTPLINALSVWLQIPDARLVIADADGHQSFIWSQCAFQAQLAFLADPTSAPPTTICSS
jgi:pimeloyl-ACP methyl ester carboxylesterase